MNERQVTDLLERAGSGLEPDVGRLVAGGAARGRARRRRRRVGVAAAVAVVAAVAVAPVLAGIGGSGSVEPGGAGEPRQVVVPREEMAAALASLLPGAVETEWTGSFDRTYEPEVRSGAVAWEGDVVTMTIDARGVGTAASPQERCVGFLGGPGCVELPDGSWTTEFGHFDLDARTGEALGEQRVVRVYTPEGYVLEAGARELPDGRLRAIALDDVWLE